MRPVPPSHNVENAPVGAVVLAAGASSRMGQPKQALVFGGETLLHRAVRLAHEAGCAPVVVVTGALDAKLRALVADLPHVAVHNPAWATGLGSSIKAGLAALTGAEAAVLLLACDQPLVPVGQLWALISRHRATGAPAVATSYADTVGIPALFARSAFAALRQLPDEEGAKKLLLHYGAVVERVECPAAALDVDTPESFDLLKQGV